MTITPFVLYGLLGCPHCGEAENYLKRAGVPFFSFVANEDPIADEGLKAITKQDKADYPVLLYKLTKQIVVGYRPEQYEQLVRDFYTRVGAGTSDTFSGQHPPSSETKVEAKPA